METEKTPPTYNIPSDGKWQTRDNYGIGEDELVCGALIGISVIAIVELMGFPQLDRPLTTAVYCFAVSIPLLALPLLSAATISSYVYYRLFWYQGAAMVVGGLGALAGVNAIFFHFSLKAGGIFTFVSLVCVLAYSHFKFALMLAHNDPRATKRHPSKTVNLSPPNDA